MKAKIQTTRSGWRHWQSLEASLALLPVPSQAAFKSRLKWIETARPNQLTPEGEWSFWLALAGRGWGKTRTGAEDLLHYGLWNPDTRLAAVAATHADLRRVIFEGQSGLLNLVPRECLLYGNRERAYNSSHFELRLYNGTIIYGYSAEKPDRLRGPEHHRAWCDEIAAWRYPEAFDNLMLGLRLGVNPQTVCTSTPRPVQLVKELLGDPAMVKSSGSTYENQQNLSKRFLETVRRKYEGTRLGRQELRGELLTDVPGALWTYPMLDKGRVTFENMPACERITVAIDPSAGDRPEAGEDMDFAEAGIVVVGTKGEHGFVLDDQTVRGTPLEWASAAVAAYHKWRANDIVAEANNGGGMVRHTINSVDRHVPVALVYASRGKMTRAEPVSALYEQQRVHHVGSFPEMEDQMTSYVPGLSKKSPDRMDALVWGVTHLMITGEDVVESIPDGLVGANQWR